MRISNIQIENFRGIKKADIYIPHNCLILGPNNSGKSTIVEAIGLLLGNTKSFYHISEYDFYGGSPTSSSRFNIIATITGFNYNYNDPTHALTEYPDWFNLEKGGRPVWWLEKEKKVVFESNPPKNAELAVQIGLTGKYDEELCEFELKRYFYDGPTDPFVLDPWINFPRNLLRKLGILFLPSSRQWEQILTFGSSQFLKLLRENEAIPANQINDYRDDLKNPSIKIESQGKLKDVLSKVESELQSFLLMPQNSNIVYRTTSLTTDSILRSLTPHIQYQDNSIIPFPNQGAGLVSLQMFLILLEFSKQRKDANKNSIFIAEEPELHLHPALQSRLIQRMKAFSDQIIVTSHSPTIAAMFRPSEVMYIQNNSGEIASQIVFPGNIRDSSLKNSVRHLYLKERVKFYEALLGKSIIIPEGKWDWQWLKLWIQVAETYSFDNIDKDLDGEISTTPTSLSVIHTEASEITAHLEELKRFRNDIAVLIDGDREGDRKLKHLSKLHRDMQPSVVLKFGENGEIEDLAAWILEPSFNKPGPILYTILKEIEGNINVQNVGECIKDLSSGHKDDWELHENLAWEANQNSECQKRAYNFVTDVANICIGLEPKILKWEKENRSNLSAKIFIADFIKGRP